jgi:hypothetical protein
MHGVKRAHFADSGQDLNCSNRETYREVYKQHTVTSKQLEANCFLKFVKERVIRERSTARKPTRRMSSQLAHEENA